MGVEVKVEGLTKSFGKALIWEDVSLTLPAGEISVLLGPSGTGKSVFLKHLVGLLMPNRGHIWINGKDVCNIREADLYEIRKLFGVLFQDGALFGSQNLYDNIAFPLREHTKKGESEIKKIVLEKMAMVGLAGSEEKLPGEISGGMRKRAGLARALVLDPQILLFDEPDSGLDPVRTAYLDQLIVDLNAQTGATCLIVTHNISTARAVPDNIGLLYRKHLAMFGQRQELLTSDEPVVRQFLNGRKQGPIGMSEEKDSAELAAEAEEGGKEAELPAIEPQLLPTWPIVRRSMASPHGSHAFLRDPKQRERVEFGAEFGKDGIEPSAEPPAKAMPADEFLRSMQSPDGDDSAGHEHDERNERDEHDDHGDSNGGGHKVEVAALAAGAGAAVAMRKAKTGRREHEADAPESNGQQHDDATTQLAPVARPRPRPTPGGAPARSRPTPAPGPSGERPRPTPSPGSNGERPRPTPSPVGARQGERTRPAPVPVAAAAVPDAADRPRQDALEALRRQASRESAAADGADDSARRGGVFAALRRRETRS